MIGCKKPISTHRTIRSVELTYSSGNCDNNSLYNYFSCTDGGYLYQTSVSKILEVRLYGDLTISAPAETTCSTAATSAAPGTAPSAITGTAKSVLTISSAASCRASEAIKEVSAIEVSSGLEVPDLIYTHQWLGLLSSIILVLFSHTAKRWF